MRTVKYAVLCYGRVLSCNMVQSCWHSYMQEVAKAAKVYELAMKAKV